MDNMHWTLGYKHHRLPSHPHPLPKICSPNTFSTQDVQLSKDVQAKRTIAEEGQRNWPAYLAAKQGALCPNAPSKLCKKKKKDLGSGEPAELAPTAVVLD